MSLIGAHEEKRRVAIYIRVSTQEQKMEGYGLEAQEKRLTEYIEKNEGLRLETKKQWLYTDVHTGSDLNRDGLNRLRDDVRAGKFDAVLVWKIDRLSRNLKHLLTIFEEFQKNHVSFISIQENIDFRGPIGNLIFQIFGAIAEFERELIKGRTQMGRITSAEMGNFTGTNIPYGYNKVPNESGKGSKLELIPEEKKWVEQIYNWYIFEDMGDGQIATRLNELKVPKTNHKRTSRASMEWTHIMVRTILTNHLYRGEFVANRTDEMNNILPEDQWTLVAIPACVSEFRFLQAQEARKQRVSNIAGTDYLLSGKLVDMDLEKPKKFVGAKRFKGGFSYRRKQFDKGGKHYSVFEIAGQQMEDFVWNKICEALTNPKAFVQNYMRREHADPKRIDMLQDQLKALRKRKAENQGAIARIEKAYEEGGYSQEKMEEKVAQRNKETVEVEMKVQEIEDQLSMISGHEIQIQKLEQISKETKDSLETADRKQKKMMCQLLIERVEMRRRKVHNHWKTHGEVIFHFNPQKFEREIEVGRTAKSLPSAERGRLGDKNDFIGGR